MGADAPGPFVHPQLSTTPGGAREHLVRSLTTWVWMLDFVDHDRALDATAESTAEPAAALAGHFRNVEIVRQDDTLLRAVLASPEMSGWAPARAAVERIESLPAEAYDCVCAHDALARTAPRGAALAAALRDYRRLLRPGGWLAIASAIPGLRRSTNGIKRAAMESGLRSAGFTEIRGLLLDHPVSQPLTMIPDSSVAMLAYESSEAMRGSSQRLRRIAARVGAPSVLYNGYVYLARA